MRVLWQGDGPVMLAPLMDALAAQGNQWKTNTVLTFLTRLSDKGMVRVEKVGRLNRYTALVGEAEYTASLTHDFVSAVYGGDAKGLIASLLQSERLSQNDLDELRAFWEGAKENG